MTPGTPWHSSVLCIFHQKSWHREGADWEYLTFKAQQPELETVIQHEDLRGCFQQTHFWLHSQFHTQPCKSCQTPAMESHPYTPWSIGKHQPRGWEHILPLGTVWCYPLGPHQSHRGGETDLKPAGDAFPRFPAPLLPQCHERICYTLGIPLCYQKSRNQKNQE